MQTVESIGVRFSLEKEIEVRAQVREERELCQKSGTKFAPCRCAHYARPGVCASVSGGPVWGFSIFFL